MVVLGNRPRRLREAARVRRGLILAWWTFTITFVFLRVLTLLIHLKVRGFGDVSLGGVHLHHYVWGILILMAVGFGGLVNRSSRFNMVAGAAYGVGLALVIDEAALLIELRDVYWSGEGWGSVALAIVLIGVTGSILVLRRSAREDD
ncbi:hypothetical protein GCM10010435_26470 [Winogradskya consettensis]|uniref:Integral membrane protein n=1 Tax=Winogradskya consettensis TaxID=113560 RepID=A0A919S935_9ACTN|nr:hypothetical protein [Actinoplanes consettensis]GIM68103.1 hypothetical protein Aco04nite_09260 [Actinoplanes consettensis]